jgi:UDP-N-acetyl-D-galactosamine dehydrogenase
MISAIQDKIVCIIGLGYVGLTLAESFSKHIKTIGFDIDTEKIENLKKNVNQNIIYTNNPSLINEADFVIIAVSTPITKSKESIIILESTVYPGVTDDILKPILEEKSGMKCGTDDKIGYSPERVNPGDKEHTINKITKIIAGMDDQTTEELSKLYGLITKTYTVKDIKTAEAAKIIENIQRDLNIVLINELTIIFHKMGLNTKAILEAAATKWNFNKYVPGLVGGHCLPVDHTISFTNPMK